MRECEWMRKHLICWNNIEIARLTKLKHIGFKTDDKRTRYEPYWKRADVCCSLPLLEKYMTLWATVIKEEKLLQQKLAPETHFKTGLIP